jgi:hypothetical protein
LANKTPKNGKVRRNLKAKHWCKFSRQQNGLHWEWIYWIGSIRRSEIDYFCKWNWTIKFAYRVILKLS